MSGYAFTLFSDVVSHRSEAKSLTAASSTEAEFIATVTAGKHARYLHAALAEFGFS